MVVHETALQQSCFGAYIKVCSFFSIIFLSCTWGIWKEINREWPPIEASWWRSPKLLQGIILLSGVLHTLFFLNVFRGKEADTKVNVDSSMGTHFESITPELGAMGRKGAPLTAYILFLGGHIAGSSALYHYFTKMSVHWAALRALGIHGVAVSAAIIAHKQALALPHSTALVYQQQQHQQQHDAAAGAAPVQSAEALGTAAVMSGCTEATPDASTDSGPAMSLQVVGLLLALLGLGGSTLNTLPLLSKETNSNGTKSKEAEAAQEDAQPQAQQSHQVQRQQHSKDTQWTGSTAASQMQELRRQLAGLRGCARSPLNEECLRKVPWTSSYTPSAAFRSRHASVSTTPALQKALAGATRVLIEQPCQDYASHLSRVSREEPGRTPRRMPAKFRVVIKLSGANLPEHMPQSTVFRLQRELEKYHCSAPATRVGCIVISCDMISDSSAADTLEEVCEGTLEVARAWAEREGLLSAEGDEITVQVCQFSDWASTHNQQASPAGYRLSMRTPFLLASPARSAAAEATPQLLEQHAGAPPEHKDAETEQLPLRLLRQADAEIEQDVRVQQQHGSAPEQEQEAYQPTERAQDLVSECAFELTLSAPHGFELRGWQSAADAPEDLPEDVKSRSLCLLASLDNRFLSVTVEDQRLLDNGEHVVQVRVSLPAASLETPSTCPKFLQLELWASGALVCSYSAVLLLEGPYPTAALAELQCWARQVGPDASLAFTRDLVTWLLFQANAQRQQQQQQVVAGDSAILLEKPARQLQQQQEQLELMVRVGRDLLHHSLMCGMVTVAGLLLDGLASLPFCIPPSALLGFQPLPAEKHSSCNAETPTFEEATPPKKATIAAPGLVDVTPAAAVQQAAKPSASLLPIGVQKAASVPPLPPAASVDLSASPFTRKQSSPLPTDTQQAPPSAPYQLSATTSADLSGSPSARAQRATPAAQPAARPLHQQGTLRTGLLRSMLAAVAWVVVGANVTQEEAAEEAAYRAWTNAQVAPLAKSWCRLWVLNMGVGALRMAWTKNLPPLLELSSWGVMILGYSLGALFIRPGSSTSEVIIAATTMSRIVYGITLGTGLVTISPTLALVFQYRLEACIEAFMMSVMERVRMRWAVPLRALLTISTASFYARLGFPWPVVQSLLVNLCGLAVTAATEWRDRHLYSSPHAPLCGKSKTS